MSKLLAQMEIDSALTALDGWSQEGINLVHDFKFQDFKAALAFINQVGELAEKADHHPDLTLHDYNRVRISLTSHSDGGITPNDTALAGEIDSLIGDHSK
ncbi:4a-hydroxytetrahydrobiopterin dehydratase [candidate division BRC1 bacterium HGW-BRC1-1]|jgi:4a-hydroxytetrahydrobiopterin dehydratase|nr:MAG: 4a-hydroxytetrahydrobiopterin dehydratase [candidate division BRC1 bacterium HGW-BRC1-1]